MSLLGALSTAGTIISAVHVMRYMTFAALGANIFGALLVWFLPDLKLCDKHNVASSLDGVGRDPKDGNVRDGKVKRW